MPTYTLRQLKYFIAVAEHGSFATAAAVVGVSQPSVSIALAKLEDQLGVQLFLRHHAQGVSLTPSGERLLIMARNLLRHADELQRHALNEGGAFAGELSVGSFVTLAAAYMPELISGFRAKYPGVSIRLSESSQDGIVQDLRMGRLELALVYTSGLPDDLERRSLTKLAPYALLPAGHKLARSKQVSLRDLAEEPFILLDVVPSHAYFLGLLTRLGIEPKLRLSSPSIEVVRGLVGRGLGYSILVTRPYGDHSYDGAPLAVRPIRESTELAEIAIAMVPGLRPTRLMSAFLDHCTEVFQTHKGSVHR